MSKQEKAQNHYGNGNDGWNESSETVGIFQGDCPADFGETGKKQVQPRHGKILVEAVLNGAQSGRPLVQKYIKTQKIKRQPCEALICFSPSAILSSRDCVIGTVEAKRECLFAIVRQHPDPKIFSFFQGVEVGLAKVVAVEVEHHHVLRSIACQDGIDDRLVVNPNLSRSVVAASSSPGRKVRHRHNHDHLVLFVC